MNIIGIDLAGTTNPQETAAAVFETHGDNDSLRCLAVVNDLSDEAILHMVKQYGQQDEVVIGIDAPLSYEFGGGDRLSDRHLRQAITAIGLKSSSIMAPTAPRMSYLTMRGIALSRSLERLGNTVKLRITEVHPGAAIGLHTGQVPVPAYVLNYKLPLNMHDRWTIIEWLQSEMGMLDIDSHIRRDALSSHEVDACAAALAAWRWVRGESRWSWPAAGVLHPYDLSC